MKPFVFDPSDAHARAAAPGMVITEVIRQNGKRIFDKGYQVTSSDLETLATIDRTFHAVRLEPDDVHENDAAIRLGLAIAGEGIERRPPVQSRVNLRADRKGLLRVDASKIQAMNVLMGIAVFSLIDRIPVIPGKIIAGAKITPVAIPERLLAAAEVIASGSPVVQVKAFIPHKVGIIATDGLKEAMQARFQETVRRKLAWYGSEPIGFVDIPADSGAISETVRDFVAQGATLILAAGGNTIDPLDPTLSALPELGAELISFGAAAHPGSMFWLAEMGEIPIVNLASCSMYSKATVADLILPWILAGERVTKADMAGVGYGGLLDRDMAFRFPPYDVDSTDETSE
jgi:hypothetical protein